MEDLEGLEEARICRLASSSTSRKRDAVYEILRLMQPADAGTDKPGKWSLSAIVPESMIEGRIAIT